ncbi:TetR/AcrR family transcriptional regulator [Streptomyces sp. NBC_00464]|uniref:acyl-CoA-like ligand-binding transcription factor n=1 Tax=Streptomyces sp. NBC_00464 TaxID=2975751 RepID=UPI002E19C69D
MRQPIGTRAVARAAVRAELAQVALHMFRSRGFENVTVADVASAAGVSRSTFLRYFASKEEAVLGALDPLGEAVAATLRDRPGAESPWVALRASMEPLIDHYRHDAEGSLALARMIEQSTALRSAHLDKKARWRGLVAEALAERLAAPPEDMRSALLAEAALGSLEVATRTWITGNGSHSLGQLVDEAFEILGPHEAL